MAVYEITLNNLNNSEPEDLIKWIKAPTVNSFKAFLYKFNLENLIFGLPRRLGKYCDKYNIEDGIDIILNKDGTIKYADQQDWLAINNI